MINKTSPSGIRFDLDQLEYIKKREKLHTPQQVVNFLLKAYWDVWHVPKNPFNIEQTTQILPTTDGNKSAPATYVPVDQFAAYENEFKACQSVEQIEKAVKVMKKDTQLTPAQKTKLDLTAREISKNFDF